MGWFQPGGAGTAIYCYDDADATGGHAAGSPHTWLECNTTFPVDFPRLQSAAGATYSATNRQYLPAVLVTIGHPTAGNTAATSFVDATDADLFVIGSRLAFTTANATTTSFTMGTKIGTGERMSGKNGGSIHMSANLIFRGTVNLYGTAIDSTVQIQFLNGTGLSMTVAGCILQAGSSFVLGNSTGTALELCNNSLVSAGTGNIITASFVTSGGGNILACTAPGSFLSSAASNVVLGDIQLSGAPTVADLRCSTQTPFWTLNNIRWSDTPGVPRIAFSGGIVLPQDGVADFRSYDVKVVDPTGNSVSGIPVYMTSDVDGAVLDGVTDEDGNVVFTWPATGATNVLPVRDYYDSVGSVSNLDERDRVYLAEINGFSGSTAPTQGFGTKFITFEWPGRDRLGTGYSPDGGSFQKVLDVIQLDYGTPSHAVSTSWIERTVP